MEEKTLDYESIFNQWRNRLFTTNDQLKEKVIEYFKWAETRLEFHNGEPYHVPILTITWLSLYIGFESRQSYHDYVKRGEKDKATEEEIEISYTLKKARNFIENHYEKLLQSGLGTWAIFALKNFDWKDIQTLEWSIDDNWEKRFVMEYVEAKHSSINEKWEKIEE